MVATNALELGIDIGHLDAAISVTFPGTVASLRQQWGRAGRRAAAASRCTWPATTRSTSSSAVIPEEFLERPVEAAILDHASESIYMRHLLTAAYEGPLEPADAEILGDGLEAYADRLVAAGELRKHGGRWLPRRAGLSRRAGVAALRFARTASRSSRPASGELLGFVEAERAFSTVHPGAVYLHLGEPYEVEELDIDGRRALVRPAPGDYYTQPKIETETFIEEEREDAHGARRARCASASCRSPSRWSPTSASASPTTR